MAPSVLTDQTLRSEARKTSVWSHPEGTYLGGKGQKASLAQVAEPNFTAGLRRP